MNKAITDGVVFQPPAFENGLDVWSSGDGTPGSDTYAAAINAALVPADQDFGSCLELQKTATTTRIRYMGETPLLPGCYLQIKARVKAVSGNLPSVRIAAFAGGAGGASINGVIKTGQSTEITGYGDVVEVTAIVGSGSKNGVDMAWGTDALYGHFGLDLTGSNGGILRIDDIEISDVSSVFLSDIVGAVDVRDFGAVGDGITDDHRAFEAADAAAAGRDVFVPAGVYFLNDNVTIESRIRFQGTVTLPADKRLVLTKNYNLNAYIDAFGDEVTGFKRGFQALINFTDHESFDLCGRRISLTEPLDMQAAVNNRDVFASRRVIRNGQFIAQDSADWDSEIFTSTGTYNPNNKLTLTNVANVSAIPIGSLIEGVGVGREIYVRDKNVSAGTITLSQPLYDAAGTQVFTFTRFKYMLDFGGFADLANFTISHIEFVGKGNASGIMLPPEGLIFHFQDCQFAQQKDRVITSIGGACQGMMIDRCQFLSNEISLKVQDRVSIGINSNSNDLKIRNNRIVRYKHFAVMGGTGSVIVGNHWFMGDTETDGVRNGGFVFCLPNIKTLITGNYIDNNFIEWTNEYEAFPDFGNQFSFGGLTVTGNIFTANDVAPWFNFFVIKPYGQGQFIQGLTMTGNVFKTLNGAIDRIESVDTTFADLDYGRMRNVLVEANTFNGIESAVQNPLKKVHVESSDNKTWIIEMAPNLPFGGKARHVESIVPVGRILSGANQVTDFPYVDVEQGTNQDQVRVTWAQNCRGSLSISARMDRPD